jgi:hypothetical protein
MLLTSELLRLDRANIRRETRIRRTKRVRQGESRFGALLQIKGPGTVATGDF